VTFVVGKVEQELAYGLENLGVPASVMRRRAEETLDLLGITALRNRSVRTLSGGELQRVALATALVCGPRVLVLDEPTSQLDPQGAEDVLAALQRLVHDLGITVLMAEHRLERVAGFADLAVGMSPSGTAAAGDVARTLAAMGLGPPVARLGAALGWKPAPLTVRDARRAASQMGLPAPPAPPAPSAGELLLRARGLCVRRGRLVALSGVDFELRRGEVVALMGRNGAGKSTLLRTLVGLVEPDRGKVVAGTAAPRPGRDAALCPQSADDVLIEETVRDEVQMTVAGTGSKVDADALLDRLGLRALEGRHPRDLSEGRRVLVAVAAIAATGAPALLLDEATRGLDPDAKGCLADFLAGHARDGGGVVFATHDVELAARIATRVVILAQGEVIADGPPAVVLGDSPVFAPQMTRVFGPGWLTLEQVLGAVERP
jgi:energy-coupling factor transport system ATP-binding protein